MKMTQFSPRPLLVTAVSLNGAHQTSQATRHAAAPSTDFLASEFLLWSEISQSWA